MAVALASGDPLPPFVVGVKADGEDQGDEEGEKPEHGGNRIARKVGVVGRTPANQILSRDTVSGVLVWKGSKEIECERVTEPESFS